MTRITVSFELEDLALEAVQLAAAAEDVSPGQIFRDAIERDLRRRDKAKRAVRTDERLVAPLRSLLADELAFSNTWVELQNRLAAKGYAFRESGGGLILVRADGGDKVCKASDLGYSHARLARRLNQPFPNHTQTRVVARQMRA